MAKKNKTRNFICTYCGSSWKESEDHVQAKSKGGKKTVSTCLPCNQSKGNKPIMEWMRWLKENDRYRWNRIVKYNSGKSKSVAVKVRTVRDKNKKKK